MTLVHLSTFANINAQKYWVYAANATTYAGGTVGVALSLKNDQAVERFETTVVLPNGVTIVSSDAIGDRATSATVTTETTEDGSATVKWQGEGLTARDGVVVALTLSVASTVDCGTYDIICKNTRVHTVADISYSNTIEKVATLSITEKPANVVSGVCGPNASYLIDTDSGFMRICGTGMMYDYQLQETPWYAFRKTVTKIEIEYGITRIGNSSFDEFYNLTSVSIPASIIVLGDHAFSDCSNLQSVTLPVDLSFIGHFAFYGCRNLSSIVIPDKVASIEPNMFSGCKKLTTVVVGKSVKSIDDFAFRNCSSLESITIPSSVEKISSSAFVGCHFLRANFINLSASTDKSGENWGATLYDVEQADGLMLVGNSVGFCRPFATNVIVPSTVTKINHRAFQECSQLQSIVIPNSVISIDDFAFDGCPTLTDVIISCKNDADFCNYLQRKDISRVFHSTGLAGKTHSIDINGQKQTSIIIPNNVSCIGNSAFQNCSGMTHVTIPNSVTSIENNAFAGCSGLSGITIPSSVTSIGANAFDGCTSLPVIDGIRYADTYLVCAVDKTRTKFEIKEGTRFVGDNSFSGCGELASIVIPNSVTYIEDSAFAGCSSLTAVNIPCAVKSIEKNVFKGCNSLLTVNIPESVTNIDEGAFRDCSKLSEADIPNSVTMIKKSAFNGCTSLTKITCNPIVPPVLGDSAYYNVNATFFVPLVSLKSYKIADGWKDLMYVKAIEETTGSCGTK